MGAGASSSDDAITEREEKFFKEMQDAYENEYKPRMKDNKMERDESLNFFKLRVNSFVDSEPKSNERDSSSGALEEKTDSMKEKSVSFKEKDDEKREPARPVISRKSSSIQPPPAFYVGDVVKAKVDGMMFEGVVVNNGSDDNTVEVDFGDEVEVVDIDDCAIVMSGLDFEVGDLVQARTADSVMYCHGKILKISLDGTFDILFDGDDEDDVERGIPHEFVRKHRTGRELVKKRWQRARTIISSMRAFGGIKMIPGITDDHDEESDGEEKDEKE